MSRPEDELPALPDRLYFKIGEVSRLVGVRTSVIRYWETEFPQVRPEKGQSGHRVYRRADVEALLKWDPKATPSHEISFTPARVIMQDFTGVPCIVDLAAMREAIAKLGGDPKRVNPLAPAELVIDQVVNDTSSRVSVDELPYRMREQLVNSGQAAVVTTYGQTPEDKTAQDLLRRQAFLKGERASQMPDPDFSLSGKITQVKRTAGDTKQVSYTFRLTLTNIRTGLESWTKTVSMTKVGNKPAVGF